MLRVVRLCKGHCSRIRVSSEIHTDCKVLLELLGALVRRNAGGGDESFVRLGMIMVV
jgi:hypothetical protein